MQLHIIHITSNCSKLEVFISEEQEQQRYDSFYDPEEEDDPHWKQEQVHRYVASSLKEYHDVCTHIGEDPEYSLWFIDGDWVDYKDIHDFPQLYTQGA